MVYDAPRPELFMKDAMMRRTVGPGAPIGIREDSTWNVPEPEIGVVLGKNGRIAGYTIGNDVSSRDIEGANPLYLPQAKIYAGACSFGPSVFVSGEHDAPVRADAARHRRVGPDRLRGRDVDGADEAILRRARPLADGGQPRPARQHPPHGHRARPARQLHPASRPLRRDPRPRDRHPRQSRRACLRADRKGACRHDRDRDRSARPQLRRRRVARKCRRRDVREAEPVAAVGRDRRLPRLDRRGCAAPRSTPRARRFLPGRRFRPDSAPRSSRRLRRRSRRGRSRSHRT